MSASPVGGYAYEIPCSVDGAKVQREAAELLEGCEPHYLNALSPVERRTLLELRLPESAGKHRATRGVGSGMSNVQPGPAGIARAYTDAVNRRAYAKAAELLADDVELIFPGGRLTGREAWLDSRARQQPGELIEEVAADDVTESDNGAEITGRLVQRWAESGEVASEMPIRIAFSVAGGAITRLELAPLPDA